MEDGGGLLRRDGFAASGPVEGAAELNGLAARIGAALDAIEAGLRDGSASQDAVSAPVPQGDQFGLEERIASLEDELETERSANAQLTDRISRLKERQEATVARIEAEKAEARAILAEVEGELQHLRAVNERLRRTTTGLREACARGVTDSSDVNEAMQAELEALIAARASERREMDALIDGLAPLVERESA